MTQQQHRRQVHVHDGHTEQTAIIPRLNRRPIQNTRTSLATTTTTTPRARARPSPPLCVRCRQVEHIGWLSSMPWPSTAMSYTNDADTRRHDDATRERHTQAPDEEDEHAETRWRHDVIETAHKEDERAETRWRPTRRTVGGGQHRGDSHAITRQLLEPRENVRAVGATGADTQYGLTRCRPPPLRNTHHIRRRSYTLRRCQA